VKIYFILEDSDKINLIKIKADTDLVQSDYLNIFLAKKDNLEIGRDLGLSLKMILQDLPGY